MILEVGSLVGMGEGGLIFKTVVKLKPIVGA
jgi:hypothetical protein